MAIGSAVVVVTVAIFVVVVTGVATTRDDDDDDDDDDDTPSTREENGFGIARRHPQPPRCFFECILTTGWRRHLADSDVP